MTDFEYRKLRCCPSRSCKATLFQAAVALRLATTAAAQSMADSIRTLNNNLANDAVSANEVFSAGNTIATGTFNYSRLNETAGVLVPTTVTIGYNTPWRQVHAMLHVIPFCCR